MASPALVPSQQTAQASSNNEVFIIIRLDGNLHHPRELDSKKDARDRKRRGKEREGAGRTGLETLRNVHPGRRPSGLFDIEGEREQARESEVVQRSRGRRA